MTDQTSFTENSGPLELGPQALTHLMDRVAEGRRRKLLKLKSDMEERGASPECLALVDEAMGLLAIVNQYMKVQYLPEHIDWVSYIQRDISYHWSIVKEGMTKKTTATLSWAGVRITQWDKDNPAGKGISCSAHITADEDYTYEFLTEAVDMCSWKCPEEGVHTLVNSEHELKQ